MIRKLIVVGVMVSLATVAWAHPKKRCTKADYNLYQQVLNNCMQAGYTGQRLVDCVVFSFDWVEVE